MSDIDLEVLADQVPGEHLAAHGSHGTFRVEQTLAADVGAKVLANLAAQWERNREAGLVLRARIEALLRKHPGQKPMTARQVLDALSIENPPSLRRIQKHLKILRVPSSVGRG